MHDFDVVVVGGGPAGLATAMFLAREGLTTALVRRGPNPPDVRTTALMTSSIALLDATGAWPQIEPRAAPLRAMRLIDATGRLFRAPTAVFNSKELGVEAFGFNIPNAILNTALEEAASKTENLTLIDSAAGPAIFEDNAVAIPLEDGTTVRAPLIAAADGRASPLRDAAGITCWAWDYPQTAVTLNLEHTAPHKDTCTEFHTQNGPFTLVPLPGTHSSSLVAVVHPSDAEFLMELDDVSLGEEIERRSLSVLGKVKVTSKRSAWPLKGLAPKSFAARRIALIGEAAHVFPPIGAQGLNLGLRDGAMLAELAGAARRRGGDIGGEGVMQAYDSGRRKDVWTRTFGIDALNRTLLSPLIPAHMARGLGLWLATSFAPVRRALMREGLRPAFGRPSAMA